ncbi:MAG: hypothetical protein QFX35_00770 [Candidatus Verstraetearchaeota archaeon]|nr:hypothetical protein [Candidatus Verstraetearchaeota archaeon]
MSFVIYAALGLLGLCTGLAILIFCNFGMIKPKEGALLGNGQAAWFIWVAGVAELLASYYFMIHADYLDAATFGGFGLFWMALGTMIYWNGDGRVLGPMAVAYTIFSVPLMFAYATVSSTLFLVLLMLVLIFLALIPAAWDKANAKVLGTLQLICLIFAALAIFGLIFAAIPALSQYSSWFLWPKLI